ncbi:TPA: hypothetical protein SMT55_000188 [Proteus mirabilis]|nr:hypothetical protein [Proteus mirabilis]HEK1719042.1 hypothetical protein [Proteus mirabilis]HEK2722620.1 hypothetical protein [Proteus mirabilis]
MRNNLKRANQKTLGYSKLSEIHDKILGTFRECEHYL